MNIELVEKKDIETLVSMISDLKKQVNELSTIVAESKNKLLDASEICEKLGIGYNSFLNRRDELTKFGMFNDGKYKMSVADLERYIEWKKNS